MHFTVIFRSHESVDLSFSLVFTPVPVWMDGDREVVNLHRDNPAYERGDLELLLSREGVMAKLAVGSKDVVLVVHDTGHGTQQDLLNLHADLAQAGFAVGIVILRSQLS